MGVAVQIQSYVMVSTDYEPETWHAFVVITAYPPFFSPSSNEAQLTLKLLDLPRVHGLLDNHQHLLGRLVALHEFGG